MSRSHQTPGVLYVVATPIGNLGDLSDRVKRVLSEADVIAAEDTRRTETLMNHLGVRKPLESYHQHTEREKAEKLLGILRDGASVALVTDAGVPVVSDPGGHLVELALREGLRVSPIPGPSAALAALSVSGFKADQFTFAGYPPRKRGERRAFYRQIATRAIPTVLFEAPHRVVESLQDAIEELGADREAFIGRELTKQFEELRRGTLAELRAHYDDVDPLGEFTLVIGPAPTLAAPDARADVDVAELLRLIAETELPTKQAAGILSAASGLSRKDAYARVLEARSNE